MMLRDGIKKIKDIKRVRFISLNTKLFGAVVLAFFIAIFLFISMSTLEEAVSRWLFTSDRAEANQAKVLYRDLNDYIARHNVAATDTAALKDWVKDKPYIDIIVYTKDNDVFSAGSILNSGNSDGNKDNSIVIENRRYILDPNNGRENAKFKTDMHNRIIRFADGDYYVYMDSNKEQRWFMVMDVVSIVIACIVFIVVLLVYNNRAISRIRKLSHEVERIKDGDLDVRILSNSNDEIGSLADSVESMRKSIVKKMEDEKAARDANSELITSMSHDIRTPLTALIGYLDIIGTGRAHSDEDIKRYIGSCRSKADQLKDLSDKLFQYFTVYGDKDDDSSLGLIDAGILLGQVLGEHIVDIMDAGYEVKTQFEIPEGIMIMVDLSKIMRLFDNLFSNISKYAAKNFPLIIKAMLINGFVKMTFYNHITEEPKLVESTKIGVKTCKKIVEDMNGRFFAMEDKNIYMTEVVFPMTDDVTK